MSNRGRPKASTKIIEVNNIRCEFIVSKTDKYENQVSYIKIVDRGYKQKLKQIIEQDSQDCKIPLFKCDDDLYMLKVKNKFMSSKKDLENNELLICDISFNHYSFTNAEDKVIMGYYAKLRVTEDEEEN
jgi:hypothetical protein